MPTKDKKMLVLHEIDRKILQKWAAIYGSNDSAIARMAIREFDKRNSMETVTTGGNGSTHEQV